MARYELHVLNLDMVLLDLWTSWRVNYRHSCGSHRRTDRRLWLDADSVLLLLFLLELAVGIDVVLGWRTGLGKKLSLARLIGTSLRFDFSHQFDV